MAQDEQEATDEAVSLEPEGDDYDLIDVSGLSVQDVTQLKRNVLAHSLERILDEADHPQDAVAGWQSAL